MYTIGEFARLGAISARMLRHYDAIGLLQPSVVDALTGYRGYEIAQLRDLNRILALRELGFSLAETQVLLGDIETYNLHEMLLDRSRKLQQDIEASQASLQLVDARLRMIEQEGKMIDDVVIKSLPALRVAAIPKAAPGFGPKNLVPILRPTRVELRELCATAGIAIEGPLFTFYTGDPDDGDLVAYVACEVGDDVDEIPRPGRILVLPPVAEAACVVRKGRGVYPQVYIDLGRWMAENAFEHVGAGRDIVRNVDVEHPENSVYEVHFPMRRPGGPTPVVIPEDVTRRVSAETPA